MARKRFMLIKTHERLLKEAAYALRQRIDAEVTARDSAQRQLKDAQMKLSGAVEKIDTLKGVARFYRAQRDRCDAYVGALLDMIGKDMPPLEWRKAENCSPEPVPNNWARNRPIVQEPGRGDRVESYRDAEPWAQWEGF